MWSPGGAVVLLRPPPPRDAPLGPGGEGGGGRDALGKGVLR